MFTAAAQPNTSRSPSATGSRAQDSEARQDVLPTPEARTPRIRFATGTRANHNIPYPAAALPPSTTTRMPTACDLPSEHEQPHQEQPLRPPLPGRLRFGARLTPAAVTEGTPLVKIPSRWYKLVPGSSRGDFGLILMQAAPAASRGTPVATTGEPTPHHTAGAAAKHCGQLLNSVEEIEGEISAMQEQMDALKAKVEGLKSLLTGRST